MKLGGFSSEIVDCLYSSFARGHTEFENRTFLDQRPDESVRPAISSPLDLVSAVPGTMIFHLNLRPI